MQPKKFLFIMLSLVVICAAFVVSQGDAYAYSAGYDFEDYTSDDGKTLPAGFGGGAGDGYVKPGKDKIYGTTLVLGKEAGAATGSGAFLPRPATVDVNKAIVIETAIMRTEIEGGDYAITMWGGAKGQQYISFLSDGRIFIGPTVYQSSAGGADIGDNRGTYEANTWYTIKGIYTPATKMLTIMIDGGDYDNLVVKRANWAGPDTLSEIGFEMRRPVADKAADLHIAYARMSNEAPEKAVYANTRQSFESFDEGAQIDEGYNKAWKNLCRDGGFHSWYEFESY